MNLAVFFAGNEKVADFCKLEDVVDDPKLERVEDEGEKDHDDEELDVGEGAEGVERPLAKHAQRVNKRYDNEGDEKLSEEDDKEPVEELLEETLHLGGVAVLA